MIREWMNGKHTILGVLVPIVSFINIYSRASLPDDIIFKAFTLMFIFSVVILVASLTVGLSMMYGVITYDKENIELHKLFKCLVITAIVIIPLINMLTVDIINNTTNSIWS